MLYAYAPGVGGLRLFAVRFSRLNVVTAAIIAVLSLLLFSSYTAAVASEPWVRLPQGVSHIPADAVPMGRVQRDAPVALALTLSLRNQGELQDLLRRLYTPGDPLYGHYLTPEQFTQDFAPTQEQYRAVVSYAVSQGLSVNTHANRLVVDVAGPAAAIEGAFAVHLSAYQSADGRQFYAADARPSIPASIAGLVSSIQGLSSAVAAHPNCEMLAQQARTAESEIASATPHSMSGGLTPAGIRTAYSSGKITQDGAGQSVAVFELDDFTNHEVSTYEQHYYSGDRLLAPVTRMLVDGGPGGPSGGGGEFEAALDVELNLAMAPHAAHIYVYEAPNTLASIVDEYNQIAADDKASVVSTSWGVWEDELGSDHSAQDAENEIFEEMAAQGQSVFSATGDYGAYDPQTRNVSAQDPATQPWVCAVGGTTLSLNQNGTYGGETCWWGGPTGSKYQYGMGTGGGVSSYWTIPSYQTTYSSSFYQNIGQNLATPSYADMASLANRNTPDVSLDADPSSGYDLYTDAEGYGWVSGGGTSASAQVWGAFVVLLDQVRARGSGGPMGFINPALYSLAANVSTANVFHDVMGGFDGNGYYSAGVGYDDATGLGSFDMSALLTQLASAPSGRIPPISPASVTAVAGDKQATVSCPASLGARAYWWYIVTAKNAPNGALAAVTAKPTATIKGLTDGTTYQFYVVAVNAAGSSAPSPLSDPVVPQAVAIAGPSMIPASRGVNVVWSTNVAANATLLYGTTPALGHSIRYSQLTLTHSASLPTSGNSKYYYEIESSDGVTTAVTKGTFTP